MNNTISAVALIGLVASAPIPMAQDTSAPADPMMRDPGGRPGIAAGSRRGPQAYAGTPGPSGPKVTRA
jgi:hypothetical protein